MHLSSIDKMKFFIKTYLAKDHDKDLYILDFGSTDICGCYRPLFDNEKWNYKGIDIVHGKNVDIVLSDPYCWLEIESNSVDVLISGQTFEHIEYFWKTMFEIARVLKPMGICCIIAPSAGPEHKHPVDCWRFLPDGFKALARFSGLEVIDISIQSKDLGYPDSSDMWKDLMLVARKPTLKPFKTNGIHIYKRTVDFNNENSLSKIIKRIKPNTSVLELGPATGYLTKYLKHELNCSVDCIEKSEEMAKQVQQFCHTMYIQDIDDMNWKKQFPQKKYDYIILADVLEHLKEDEKTLNACRTLLKSNGECILSIPNIAHASIIGELLKGRFDYRDEGILDKTHLKFYTKNSIEQLITKCGFSIKKIDPIYNLPENTEIGDALIDLPFEVQNLIYNQKNSFVYQFVITCKPGNKLLLNNQDNTVMLSPADIRKSHTASLLERIAALEAHNHQLITEQKKQFTEYEKKLKDLHTKLQKSKDSVKLLYEQIKQIESHKIYKLYKKMIQSKFFTKKFFFHS